MSINGGIKVVNQLTFVCSRSTIKKKKVRNMFKENNKNAGATSLSGAFIVNFEHLSHLFLVFLLLTLNKGNKTISEIC